MILSHIVARSQNGIIGLDGKMPWHLSEDLKHFKRVTMGHVVVMGRKTYESIGRPLPGRHMIVLSSKSASELGLDPSIKVFASIEDALSYIKSSDLPQEEVFIIGGGEIYRQTLDQVERVYLTEVHQDFEGDVAYPEVPAGMYLIERQEYSGDLDYSISLYQRQEWQSSL